MLFLGTFSWAVELGAGLFLQKLADPSILVFLLLSPAKEQYFIPGRRVGGTKASLAGPVAMVGRGLGSSWGSWETLGPLGPSAAASPSPCRHGGLPAEQ